MLTTGHRVLGIARRGCAKTDQINATRFGTGDQPCRSMVVLVDIAPCREDRRALFASKSDRTIDMAVIARPDRPAFCTQLQRRRCAKRIEVDDDQTAIAPQSSEMDQCVDRRVIPMGIRRAGIEHADNQERTSPIPNAPQFVSVLVRVTADRRGEFHRIMAEQIAHRSTPIPPTPGDLALGRSTKLIAIRAAHRATPCGLGHGDEGALGFRGRIADDANGQIWIGRYRLFRRWQPARIALLGDDRWRYWIAGSNDGGIGHRGVHR